MELNWLDRKLINEGQHDGFFNPLHESCTFWTSFRKTNELFSTMTTFVGLCHVVTMSYRVLVVIFVFEQLLGSSTFVVLSCLVQKTQAEMPA